MECLRWKWQLGAVMVLACLLATGCRRNASLVTARSPQAPAGILPAGTVLAVRTVGPINPAHNRTGEGFPVVVGRELIDSRGQAVATPGAPARLVMLPSSTGSESRLGIAAIMLYGAWHVVNAAAASGAPVAIGGGAPLGTLLRAVSDGAVVNTSDSRARSLDVITSGGDVTVPPGVLLVFRLDEAAVIEGVDAVAR